MMDSVLECLDRKEVRQRILEVYTEGHPENWQKNATPEWVVRDMVGLVKDSPELVYVVLFNQEFLEELVFERGISKERIIFMADCADEGVLATGVYGVRTMVLPQEIRDPKKTIEFVAEKLCKVLYEGGPMPKTNNLVVFGNPPYQKEDGGHGKSAAPIYHLFVQAVLALNPRYHSFIIPSRWMLGGKGLDSFREYMLKGAPSSAGDSRRHISKIVDFKSATKVFKADIAGGVCYYLWDREHDGLCEYDGRIRKLDEFDVFIRDNVGLDIVHKVLYHHKGRFLNTVVSARKPYGFDADTTPTASGVPCWFKQSQGKLFVDPSIVKDPRGDLGKWKVLGTYAPIAGQTDFDKPLGFFSNKSLIVASPGECCSETYLVLNSFSTEQEALCFKAYILTKFFRFMLLMRVVSQHVTSEAYSWVPDLGSYTVVPTDEELFKMFGLMEDEVAYIKSRVK